jgi:hypothetical protein
MEKVMNASQFDHWTTILTTAVTRRGMVRGLLIGAGTLSATLAPVTLLESAAKKKHRKNKKHKCKAGTKRCGKACIPADACCTDAECDAQEACIGGKCAVPCGPACDDLFGSCATTIDGAEVCAGKVIPELVCDARPCTADSQCGGTEFCGEADCPPVGGVTNRCQGLRLP